jgi:hypothetical protein
LPSASRTPVPTPVVRLHSPALVDAVFTHGAGGLEITADTPGCAVAIGDQGSVMYSNGYGLADLTRYRFES